MVRRTGTPQPAANNSFLRTERELTALAPDWSPEEGRWDGVTFTFIERAEERLLVLDAAELACRPSPWAAGG